MPSGSHVPLRPIYAARLTPHQGYWPDILALLESRDALPSRARPPRIETTRSYHVHVRSGESDSWHEVSLQLKSLLLDCSVDSSQISAAVKQNIAAECEAWATNAPTAVARPVELLESIRSAHLSLLEKSDRGTVLHHLSRVLELSQEARRAPSPEGETKLGSQQISADHLQTASEEQRRSRTSAIVALVLLLAAGASAFWGTAVIRDAGDKLSWGAAFPGVLCVALLSGSALAHHGAKSRALAAREQERIARAIIDMEVFLAPLPDSTRFLMRAKMAPVLFPLLLENDDPLRAVQWPQDDNIMTTILGYVEDMEEQPEPSSQSSKDPAEEAG